MRSFLKFLIYPVQWKTHMEVLMRYLLYQSLALSYKSRINNRETYFEAGCSHEHEAKLSNPWYIFNDPKYKSEWTKWSSGY